MSVSGGAATSAFAAASIGAAGGTLLFFGVGSAGGGADSMRGAGTDSRRGAGVESRRGAGLESRRGLGGGARRREVVGAAAPAGGTEPLPGSDAGGGIGELRMSGRVGAPGGRLGVPTETTGTLGILGGGMLSELVRALASALVSSAVTSASSMVEDSGFEVMRV